MPIHSCQSGGTKGEQWGEHGHCYTGAGAKAKAGRQAGAAHAHGYTGESEVTGSHDPADELARLIDKVFAHGRVGPPG